MEHSGPGLMKLWLKDLCHSLHGSITANTIVDCTTIIAVQISRSWAQILPS